MPTHTYYDEENGVLRHGHGNINAPDPTKEQWHNADQFHRSDPDAHEREDSWDSPNWSRKNQFHPSYDRKRELLDEAHDRHDANRAASQGRSYTPRYRPVYTPAPVEPDEPDEPEDDESEDTSELAKKVQQASELALMAANAAGVAADLAKEASRQGDTLRETLNHRVDEAVNSTAAVSQRLQVLESAAANKIEVTVRRPDLEPRVIKTTAHKKFPLLLKYATALSPSRRNIWIAGPAGGGKSHSAEQLADVLGLPFDYIGAVDSPYKLSGHKSATGVYQDTAFYRIYKNGGVILLDEVDGGAPAALLEINAALANSKAAFPCGLVERHPDCIIIAAANTWGYGGDANYVGRNKIDVAFLTRFVKMTWDYDEDLERQIAGSPGEWIDVVQAVRREAFKGSGTQGMVISPRASQIGCELLTAGLTNEEVVEATFGDFRKHSAWPTIGKAAEDFAKRSTISSPGPQGAQYSTNPVVREAEDVVVNTTNSPVFGGYRR